MADVAAQLAAKNLAVLERLLASYPARREAMMLNRTLKRTEQTAELARLDEEREAIAFAIGFLQG